LARKLADAPRRSAISPKAPAAAGPQSTAAYIAELTGELAILANGARFPTLAQLLSRAQLEAELWSRQG
jgi:hypothetical protein